MTVMRAKFEISSVTTLEGGVQQVKFRAVGPKARYGAEGKDEDNTFAKFTPNASLDITINNPDLLGVFAPGQKLYADFTAAEA